MADAFESASTDPTPAHTAPIWEPLGVVCQACLGQTRTGAWTCTHCGQPIGPRLDTHGRQIGGGIVMPDGRLLSPQQAAVESPADELAFGGGSGGGKSYLMLGLAVTQHRRTTIYRREFAQFRDAGGLWQQSIELIGIRGVPAHFAWRELPGDRQIAFRAAGHLPQHWLRQKGKASDLIGFDELTEIPSDAYRFLIGWLRSGIPGQRQRVVATFNPPLTAAGQWVLEYWGPWLLRSHPRPAKPGELRWYVEGDQGESLEVDGPTSGSARPDPVLVSGRRLTPRSRTFLPSTVEDNPYYLRTGYADVLDAMPNAIRALVRTGDFAAAIPDDRRQVIPTAWVEAAQARWTPDGGERWPLSQIGVDPAWGGEDEFAIALRRGPWLAPLKTYPGAAVANGIVGAELIWSAVGSREVPVQIDAIGGGLSCVDQCTTAYRMLVVPLIGSERTDETTRAADPRARIRFANRRAKWYWRMRELLDPSNTERYALPPDPVLKADLTAVRWTMTTRGLAIEEKDLVRQRLGRSPDRGEAAIYASVQETEGALPEGASPIIVGETPSPWAVVRGERGDWWR